MDDTGTTVHRNRMPIAAGSGVIFFVLFWLAMGWGFFWALIGGVVIFAILLVVLGMIGDDSASATGTSGTAMQGDPPASASGTARPAGHVGADAGGSTVPPSVAGGGAAAGGGVAGGTSPAATGTPIGEGADAASARTDADAAAASATHNSAPVKTSAAAPTSAVPSGGVIGTKPETLDAPRGTGADDLKKIKGVGPKLEAMCNRLGFWHYDQIAGWSEREVAWVDDNLEGFKGRVQRDDWVSQAKTLASGGETAFSRKASKER